MIGIRLSNSKFILTNQNGHSKKCHSPLLLFHAGHYSDISRQFTYSFSVITAAIICDLKILQDWRIWCLITSQNFLIQFANEWLWTSSLIFSWHLDSWTWSSGETYFQVLYPFLPITSNHSFSLFPKNSLISPFTIISKQEKLLLLLFPEVRYLEIVFEVLFHAFLKLLSLRNSKKHTEIEKNTHWSIL